MLSKRWCVVLAVLGFAAFGVGSASARGGGAKGSHPGGGVGPRCGTGWANSGQFPRTGSGIVGPAWAYGNPYSDLGYGYGYPGWGYSQYGLGYSLEDVPYFAMFPPVYFGYEDNVPVVKTSIRSSWAGGEIPQPVPPPAASASSPCPPLRIVNPYYVEEKADKP